MAKYDELIKSYDKQSTDLRSFLAEKGDNITADDLTQANAIKADLKNLRDQIKVCEEAESLRREAEEHRSFVEAPARGHTHSAGNGGAKVMGATKAGESVFYKADGSLKRNKALQLVRETGPGAFGAAAFGTAQTPEYKREFRNYMKGRAANFRTLEDGIDSQGGYLAPVEVVAKLIEKKPAPTSVSSYCDTINTGRDAVSLSRVNYTGNSSDDSDGNIYTTGVRVTLTDENPSSSTASQVTDTNLFGSVRVAVYTWMLQAALTNNVLEDATFDPLSWLSGKFSETIDQLKDKMCVLGDPAGPTGVLSNPGATDTLSSVPVIKTGLASSPFLTPDSIINLTEDLPTQYDSNVRYLYRRRTTGKTIRTFKDAAGRYLFGQGLQDSGIEPGRGSMLNSYPVSWSDWMPDPAANAYPVVAGDFGGITIVNRIGFSVQVLRKIAAQKNQVIIIGRVRFGVQVLEPWRLRVLQSAV